MKGSIKSPWQFVIVFFLFFLLALHHMAYGYLWHSMAVFEESKVLEEAWLPDAPLKLFGIQYISEMLLLSFLSLSPPSILGSRTDSTSL